MTLCQHGDGGAEVRRWGIPEIRHERVPFKRTVHGTTLYADATTVDEAYLVEASRMGLRDEFRNHGCYVPRRERVQVKRILDRYPVCHWADDRRFVVAAFLDRRTGLT